MMPQNRLIKDLLPLTFLILLVLNASLRCQASRSYHLHIGEPFFSFDQLSYMRFPGQDVAPDTVGMSFRVQGIYTAPDSSSSIHAPLIRFHERRSGLCYVSLLTDLEVEDGDLVEISGTVARRVIDQHKASSIHQANVLAPEEVHLLRPSSRLKRLAQREYSRIRQALQNSITPEGSRLVLPEIAKWFVVWSKSDRSFIVSFRQTDLMYQAEVDCIFQGGTEVMTDIYAFEWFKGE